MSEKDTIRKRDIGPEFKALIEKQKKQDEELKEINKQVNKPNYYSNYEPVQQRFKSSQGHRSSQAIDRRHSQAPQVDDDKNKDTLDTLKQYRQSLKYYDQIGAISGLLGLIIAVFEFENFYPHYQSTITNDILRGIISLTTLILVVSICKRSYIQYKIQVQKRIIPVGKQFHKTTPFTIMMIELILNIIHCPPRVDTSFYVDNIKTQIRLSLDGVFMSLMLLRIYLLSRIFAHNSKWLSENAQEQADKVNCEANIKFAIKAILKEKPIWTMVFFIFISDLILALAVRHYELAFYEKIEKQPLAGYQDYSQLVISIIQYLFEINSMWFIMITMLTIGFGDYYPKTHQGRAICIIACFLGVFIISMIVVSVTNQITLTKNESQAFDVLYKRTLKKKIKEKATRVVWTLLKLNKVYNDYEKRKTIEAKDFRVRVLKLNNQLINELQEFRDMRKNLYEEEISTDEILRQFTEKLTKYFIFYINKIQRDLSEIKKSLQNINAIRESLQEIENSQDVVLTTIAEVNKMTKFLDEILMKDRFRKK